MANDIDIAGLLKRFISDYGATKTERKKRYGAGVSELTDIIGMFKPGGKFAKKTTGAALDAAKAGFAGAGIGGVTPTAVSSPFASVIERLRAGGEAGALANRAQFKAKFPKISPSPSAITNLATGGFAGLTRQFQAEAPGGPLSDPYQYLSGGGTRLAPAPRLAPINPTRKY